MGRWLAVLDLDFEVDGRPELLIFERSVFITTQNPTPDPGIATPQL
jgi:hypothetical protein